MTNHVCNCTCGSCDSGAPHDLDCPIGKSQPIHPEDSQLISTLRDRQDKLCTDAADLIEKFYRLTHRAADWIEMRVENWAFINPETGRLIKDLRSPSEPSDN